MTIILYGMGATPFLAEAGPFVTMSEVLMRMAGLAYEAQNEQPGNWQLPWVDDAGVRVSLVMLRGHIERKYQFDFDGVLNLGTRMRAWAFERVLERQVGLSLPADRVLDAVEAELGDKPFLFGDEPTAADAFTFGMLAPRPVCKPSPLREAGARRPRLADYAARMTERFYPEHGWCACKAA